MKKVKRSLKILLSAALGLLLSAPAIFSGCGTGGTLRWVKKTITQNYYKDVEFTDFNGSLYDFVSDNLDKYSRYYTAAEYRATLNANAGYESGAGFSDTFVTASRHPENKTGALITRVWGNSPAYYSGMRTGEIITSITYGGEEKSFLSYADFESYYSSIPSGREFIMNCDRHAGGHAVRKTAYTTSYCTMSTADKTYTVSYPAEKLTIDESEGLSVLPEGAAYLKLDQFYGRAAEEFIALVGVFNEQSCTSLILDLRGNGGGYLSVVQSLADVFVGNIQNAYSAALYSRNKNGRSQAYPVNKGAKHKLPAGVKVSVLADDGTASAAECLIGVLISNGVAGYGDIYLPDYSQQYLSFVGSQAKNRRTYGKGIMQSNFTRGTTGETLKLTTAYTVWPDGETVIHDKGVTESDGCNVLEAGWNVVYGDPFLARAVSAIYGEREEQAA